MVLVLAVREAIALSKQEGGSGELMDCLKVRDPPWGIKPPISLVTCRPLRITPLLLLPRWLVLALAMALAVREALVLSKQEGGFVDLMYRPKGRNSSWGINPPLCSGTWRLLRLTHMLPLQWWMVLVLVLGLTLLLLVRELFALSEQEGVFKDLTEGSDRIVQSWGDKSRRWFKLEQFVPSNADVVADTYTADADAAVHATGWILFF